MSEVIINIQEVEDDSGINIPDIEEFILDDAIAFINSRFCTVLCNLLGIERVLSTTIHAMYPYPYTDYIYDGMYVPIPKDEYDDPLECKLVDGRYADDQSQIPYIILNGGPPQMHRLSLWYKNNEGIITPENVIEPHMFVHLCHNSRMHKMYCEFTYDRFMLNYLRSTTGIYSYFRDKACKKIYNEYTDFMGQHERIFMVRPRLYCPKEYSATDILTINTVGHWQTLQGKQEFLNDKIEAELAFTQYKLSSNQSEREFYNKLEGFAGKVHELNGKFLSGKFSHNKAFKDYRNYYNHEFRDPYEEENPDTGEMDQSYYNPLYDFYEKFYVIYFTDLIPDKEEENII